MPGVNIGNPPGIRTPGAGPNGPMAVDCRMPVASVSNVSSVPYGPTNGYATPNRVTGFIGPAAGSLQQPFIWYVRSGGNDNNGGSTSSLSATRSGTSGSISSSTKILTVTDASFTSADVGQIIRITSGGLTGYYPIVSVTDSTHAVTNVNGATTNTITSWSIGGALASPSTFLGGYSGLYAGDTVYIGAGVYRATISVNTAVPFNGQANIVGDVTGQYTGDAGMVQLTAYTTNDKTAPSATTLLNLNGKSNLAFSNIQFTGGVGVAVAFATSAQNISFTDCALLGYMLGGSTLFTMTAAFGVPLNAVFDRCLFVSSGFNVGSFTLTTGGTGNDYDVNATVKNCLIIGGAGTTRVFNVTNSGTLTFKGGGVMFRNNTAICNTSFLTTTASQNSTIFPCIVDNSFLYNQTGVATLNAGTSGQITESYNILGGSTPRTNVTAGTGTIADGSYAPLFHFGQERIWGGLQRAFGEPMSGSPLLGFGNDGAQTLYDLMNRPRPAGGGSGFPLPAVGALERSNTAAQATSPVPPAGTHDWQFTGPGYQDFLLPVSNAATTVAISVQRDSAYAAPPGATLPAMLILANGTLGVTAQTITDTGASGGWNTLISAQFTPSGTGWVTVRIASYDGSGTSVVSFANVSVT